MEDNLTIGEYHGVRGALSGVIICSLKLGLPVNAKYISWLQDYDHRMDEKTRIICIEQWDCDNLVISSATGWGDCARDGYFESPVPNTSNCCVLISRECWTEAVPRNFPGTSGGGGTTSGGGVVGGGQSGTHGDTENIFEIKSATLRTWMDANGVPDEFFDLLYDCVIYLPSPLGGAAENFVNEECVEAELESLAADLLNQGFMQGHFSSTEYQELSELSNAIPFFPLSFGVPRLEYIDQIDKIQQYLAKRHTDYGEAAQYLADLLPFLIQTEEYTTPEVYQIYLSAKYWLDQCRYNYLSAIVRNIISATRPFIEMALIETGFQILAATYSVTANASRRIVQVLPLPVRNSSQLVWNRISATSLLYRPNTIIPETFVVTAERGQQFYVQYSATEHLYELVALRGGAATRSWFESQKALRSQLVVDDFVRAIDDITVNNPSLVMERPYHSGQWEIIFGAPTSTVQSGGLINSSCDL